MLFCEIDLFRVSEKAHILDRRPELYQYIARRAKLPELQERQQSDDTSWRVSGGEFLVSQDLLTNILKQWNQP